MTAHFSRSEISVYGKATTMQAGDTIPPYRARAIRPPQLHKKTHGTGSATSTNGATSE